MPTYSETISEYVTRKFAVEDDTLAQIRREIPQRGLPKIMISAEEANFLHFMVVASRAQRAVEIGTLGGYSGIWIARGLPEDGELHTLEVDPRHAEVARSSFRMAGVAGKIHMHEGDALEILPTLTDEGPFDFVFIDANKQDYPQYLDWALENLAVGGVVAAHNAFAFGGRIVEVNPSDEKVAALQLFNERLATDPRLVATIFPAGDGIAVAVLKERT